MNVLDDMFGCRWVQMRGEVKPGVDYFQARCCELPSGHEGDHEYTVELPVVTSTAEFRNA